MDYETDLGCISKMKILHCVIVFIIQSKGEPWLMTRKNFSSSFFLSLIRISNYVMEKSKRKKKDAVLS